MLAPPPERLEEALGRLEPTRRALLELSLHREVADPALAELLRTDVDTVARQRSEALANVADALEASPGDVEEVLVQHWRGAPMAEEPEEPETPEAPEEPEEPDQREPEPEADEPEADEPEADEPEREPAMISFVAPAPAERRSRRRLWVPLAAAAALVVVLVLVLSGGGDDEPEEAGTGGGPPAQEPSGEPAPPAPPGEPAPPSEPASEPLRLEPLAGGDAAGTVRVEDGNRVVLEASGLSGENHAVWLYSSLTEARALASFDGPEATARFRLPDGFERFQYLDVSREPPNGNPNHSGESVLRIATRDLRAP